MLEGLRETDTLENYANRLVFVNVQSARFPNTVKILSSDFGVRYLATWVNSFTSFFQIPSTDPTILKIFLFLLSDVKLCRIYGWSSRKWNGKIVKFVFLLLWLLTSGIIRFASQVPDNKNLYCCTNTVTGNTIIKPKRINFSLLKLWQNESFTFSRKSNLICQCERK